MRFLIRRWHFSKKIWVRSFIYLLLAKTSQGLRRTTSKANGKGISATSRVVDGWTPGGEEQTLLSRKVRLLMSTIGLGENMANL